MWEKKERIFQEESHLRKNPLNGKWVITYKDDEGNKKEGECPCCRGDKYLIFCSQNIRVVPDDNPIFRVEELVRRGYGIYDIVSAKGADEVIVESQKHNDKWTLMTPEKIKEILTAVQSRILDLKQDPGIKQVLWYKNCGELVGVEDSHPHSIIIGSPEISPATEEKLRESQKYWARKQRCLVCDIIDQEIGEEVRIVLEDSKIIALAPFWARMPFEVLILPKKNKHSAFFEESTDTFDSLAAILKEIVIKLAKVIGEEVSYTLVCYTGPNTKSVRAGYWKTIREDFHWHIEILPKTRRYIPFEISTGFHINNMEPEEAAKLLREA